MLTFPVSILDNAFYGVHSTVAVPDYIYTLEPTMPHLATAASPLALARSVEASYQRFRFLAAIAVPDLANATREGKYLLYGSHENCTAALHEALNEHPDGRRHAEYEYLPNAVISEMVRGQLAKDPKAQAMRSLGEVKSDS